MQGRNGKEEEDQKRGSRKVGEKKEERRSRSRKRKEVWGKGNYSKNIIDEQRVNF